MFETINDYVTRRNQWNALFGEKTELNVYKKADRCTIAEMLQNELSPENLSCDGELSYAQIKTRKMYLEKALYELQWMDSL